MSRNWSKAVPKGNGPAPQQEEFMRDKPKLADVHRLFEEILDSQLNPMKSHFDQQDGILDELMQKTRETRHRSASLEKGAWQSGLAMEADVTSDKKTRNRTEDVAAERVISGDNCSANQVDPDQMCRTSFGDDSTGPLALPCSRDEALVDNDAATPKPCLSPVDLRTPTAAGGLLPTGTASTVIRTIIPRPFFS